MKYELTVPTNEYYQIRTGLTWADILNVIQGICAHPAKFHCVDFLIRMDWDNGVAAVFCSQGPRRHEVVITMDTRNPHIAALELIERALDDLRAERAMATSSGIADDEDDIEWVEDDDR